MSAAARAHQPEGALYPVYQFPADLVPAIDGDITDWNVVPESFWITLEEHFDETVRAAGKDDLSDFNLRCVVGWSEATNRLYFMAHVDDDYLNNSRGESGHPNPEFSHDDDINVSVAADAHSHAGDVRDRGDARDLREHLREGPDLPRRLQVPRRT